MAGMAKRRRSSSVGAMDSMHSHNHKLIMKQTGRPIPPSPLLKAKRAAQRAHSNSTPNANTPASDSHSAHACPSSTDSTQVSAVSHLTPTYGDIHADLPDHGDHEYYGHGHGHDDMLPTSMSDLPFVAVLRQGLGEATHCDDDSDVRLMESSDYLFEGILQPDSGAHSSPHSSVHSSVHDDQHSDHGKTMAEGNGFSTPGSDTNASPLLVKREQARRPPLGARAVGSSSSSTRGTHTLHSSSPLCQPLLATPPRTLKRPRCSHAGADAKENQVSSTGLHVSSAAPRVAPMGWEVHNPESWATLHATSNDDEHMDEMPQLGFRCSVDKGMKQAVMGEGGPMFIVHKKNHFQISVSVRRPNGRIYVELADGSRKPLDKLMFGIQAVHCEDTSLEVRIDQSLLDRSRMQVAMHDVPDEADDQNICSFSIGRLHFSQTTANNIRKRGLPNVDQRYFALVATLYAKIGSSVLPVAAHISDHLVVRASNPAQFEQQANVAWVEGTQLHSIHHTGAVGINTSRPDEAMTVHGNVRVTGAVLRPSDRRIKTNIKPVDTGRQLQNIVKIGLYSYCLTRDWAKTVGREDSRECVGVIAQELQQVIPEAVKETGTDHTLVSGKTITNLCVVDHDRLFMDTMGAVKEIANLQDKLLARSKALKAKIAAAHARVKREQTNQAAAQYGACALVGAVAVLTALVCRS